jgi:DNA-binding LacI/PurR family transcriptional regulator
MVTIEDVARRAGVSRSTVSYALSGKRTISRRTRERIEAAIADLGFTPHAGARALATSRTKVIGLFVQFFADEFSPAMLQYILPISDAARDAGYDLLMVTDTDGARALERVSASGMVDGVILLNVGYEDPRLAVMQRMGQPGSMVGAPHHLPHGNEGFDVFDLDFPASGRLIVDHLAGQGHREIVLITPPEEVYARGGAYAWRFRDAALARAAERGLDLHWQYGQTRQPAVSRQFHELLDAGTGTAMIIHNDAAIAALPPVLSARGVRVPEDLSVVGIYSEDFGRLFSLPYTAVETSPDELGRLAVQALVRRMARSPVPVPPVAGFIAPRLIERGSTATRTP